MDGIDFGSIMRMIAAFFMVLALMGGLTLLLRFLNTRADSVINSRKRRLKVIETLPLDHRRKAVLLQRDDAQHLIILGNENETVVETNIESPDDMSTQTKNHHVENDQNKTIFPLKKDSTK